MTPQEVAQAFVEAFNSGDLDSVASYLADDFQFSGAVSQPTGAQAWIGLTKALRSAFPDIDYRWRIVGVEGNVVKTVSQPSGTHTGDLDLSAMDMGVIPPTGKSFSNPEEPGDLTIEGGKITKLHIESGAGSGLPGILAQLGVAPPG